MDLLKNEVFEKLRTMLLRGEFEPGKTYSLNKLAEALSVSRTPVRDAIIRLSNEKRVDILPSRGFCLHRMTPDEIENRGHFSDATEGYCIVRLAQACHAGRKPPEVEQLVELVERMEQADLDTLSFREFYELDNSFHNTLLMGVGKAFYEAMLIQNLGFVDHPELHLGLPVNRRRVLSFHRRIVDAILAGDAASGYRAILEHAAYMISVQEAKNSKTVSG